MLSMVIKIVKDLKSKVELDRISELVFEQIRMASQHVARSVSTYAYHNLYKNIVRMLEGRIIEASAIMSERSRVRCDVTQCVIRHT